MVRQSVQSILVFLALMHNASALLTRIKNAIVQNINPETVMLLQADQQSTCDRVVNSDFFNANAYTEPGNMKTIMCKFFNATAADPTEFRPGVTLVISNMSLCTDDDSKTDESCPQNGCCGYGQCTADTEQKNQVCHFDRDHLLDIEFSVHNPEDSDVQSDVEDIKDCSPCKKANAKPNDPKYAYFSFVASEKKCVRVTKAEIGTEVKGSVSGKCP